MVDPTILRSPKSTSVDSLPMLIVFAAPKAFTVVAVVLNTFCVV